MTSQSAMSRTRYRTIGWSRWLTLALLATAACMAGEEAQLPPNLQDPEHVRTPAGAMAFYGSVVGSVPTLINDSDLLRVAGLLTDELMALPLPVGATGFYTGIDSRQDLVEKSAGPYGALHSLRAQARDARGFLSAYASDSSPALGGHLYALEGYAELFLADLYCSGIPLSTVDFQGDYTLTPGFSTAEVYDHALMLFDSAAVLTADSLRLQSFAAVGRGRALLALGRYADATAAVAAVPDDYAYQVVLPTGFRQFLYNYRTSSGEPSAADREGGNGFDYRSSGDPRTLSQWLGSDVRGYDMFFPAKYYPPDAPAVFTLASGLEARLIEAEAALQAGNGEWLTKLNVLRTDGTYDTQPNAADPSQTDTLWHAGTGAVAGLRPLSDPGAELADPAAADSVRVDLLFRERAFWLYMTGHRQGDLRRLIRQYGRVPNAVYPTGSYPGGSGRYGSEVVAPVPDNERKYNPKYTGCINRNA